MSPIETTKIISKFSYVTKPKPSGGFIAYSSDPTMVPIEGATEEEVQQKILAQLATYLGQQGVVGRLLKGFLPVNVKLDSRSTVVFNSKSGRDFRLNPQTSNSASDAPAPVRFERNKMFLPAILVMVVVAAILYVVLR